MLTMDVDQLDPQLMQNGHRHQGAVYPADILSVQIYLPVHHGFRVIFHSVFGKPGKLRNLGKHRPDTCLVRPGTDHIPIGPLPQNGSYGINNNGFTGTGFAGQDIKAAVKGNIRTLNNRNVLNVQQAQHGTSLLWISSAGP